MCCPLWRQVFNLSVFASRGLQVIVLTCNHRDYETLGAYLVDLAAATARQGSLAVSATVTGVMKTSYCWPIPREGSSPASV